MCVINQSEIKVADADMIVYKYVDVNNTLCVSKGCLNVYHITTDHITNRRIVLPCTFSYKIKAENFVTKGGYTCFTVPPTFNLTKSRSTLKRFLIKRGTRYKTGSIAPECDYEYYQVIQAEQLEEFHMP